MANNRLLRMDNVSIVVESLDNAISFFKEIGLKLGEILSRSIKVCRGFNI
ncbi:hypothetical protein IGA_00507 [Bacillus cereus HuA3-9]|uniref:Glyoxalase n=1 Tax=Bacillus cereus HuA3-9 TaxID=1053205 RepID=R8DFK9_BACCE|nr:hypothetical protein IGA_00507 [Bacillus cereus HuA3-9]